MNKKNLLTILIPLLFLSACASNYLKNANYRNNEDGFMLDEKSKIPDTATNRAILDVLARYRTALVKKDIGTINSLVASSYYENAGTTDTTVDDYGAKDLPAVYELFSKHTDDIRYNITVKEMKVDGDTAYVDYDFKFGYHSFVDGKPAWDAGDEINRISFVKENGTWKISSGL